ncbi:hypothetical protein HFO61_35205 [Rhizobium leguminosarum]|uniref:hypothetical protein n=1 Tax=Rhizobium leguminosarum TaxID=384 RepID=UPI001C976CC0|nr:hypothetical protein [Rhizobium leguminosarum]MBY5551932.1 hypothetical protein [Rhizobium leguminosarum]
MDTDYDETAVPPPLPHNENLAAYWCRPVSALATVPAGPALLPAEKERHRLYALLTLAITAAFFNGNKLGQEGSYPWREKQKKANGSYDGNDYFGHNIACIAVSGTGEVIDFDFNHNELFNSSAEHAEARLVRRIFNLNQIYDHWETKAYDSIPPAGYGTVLSSVTIYTSLESCAQCSGIMTLGNVK